MKLVIFDCDGTLVDSQHAIVAAMEHAYATVGLPCPTRQQVLGIVGLSLPECFRVLSPDLDEATRADLARLYKDGNWGRSGQERVHDPLFPGAADLVAELARRDDVVLGVATGKSRRGLDDALRSSELQGVFDGSRTADETFSKPHPAMLEQIIDYTGSDPRRTLMIGDTSHDLLLAQNAHRLAAIEAMKRSFA